VFPSFLYLQLSPSPAGDHPFPLIPLTDIEQVHETIKVFDRIPVIDTHSFGVIYVSPHQDQFQQILANTHGSPAYTRFLEGLGRLIRIRGQLDVYTGDLAPETDGEYTIAWWDDIGQCVFHVATLMPNEDSDKNLRKQALLGNDMVKIVWNDSGSAYRFDTFSGDFNFVNIVIEAHSSGIIGAYSNDVHENEFFKVTVQRRSGMPDFACITQFTIINAKALPQFVRNLALCADWFSRAFKTTMIEGQSFVTHWRWRLQHIKRLKSRLATGSQGQQLHLKEAKAENEEQKSLDRHDFTQLY
jgi:tuberous sclerosis protein 2